MDTGWRLFRQNNVNFRNIYYKPFFLSNKKWLFWQYTDRQVLNGYNGAEKYIDMNIFNGDIKTFEKLFN